MKLFQQMLVAPAALGLLAPLAVNAAELNINEVSDYASSSEVQSFSDVYPTDWAFQALTSLAERHGCAVATPNGSITRYEAASLLNSCLGDVAQVNEEERRLINEFAPEIAIIKGRIDGLESRVGEFEAGQFSKTTVLTGSTSFVVGGVTREHGFNDDAVTLSYSTDLETSTTLTGDDLLYTKFTTGNMGSSTPWGSTTNGTQLDVSNTSDTYLEVDSLWYSRPIGDFTLFVGPKIMSDTMLASAPSIYKPVQKQFALGGNGATYGSATTGGFGVAWTQPKDDPSAAKFAISSNYLSMGIADQTQGVLADGQTKWLSSLAYGSPRWSVSLAYAAHSCTEATLAAPSCKAWTDIYSTELGSQASGTGDSAVGFRAHWKPEEVGMVPAIQFGYDTRTIDGTSSGEVKSTAQWMVGLMWDDVIVDGNSAGFAYGSRQHATEFHTSGTEPADENAVWEAYYDFKVNDNMTVTPTIFGGEDTYNGHASGSDDIFGGLVKTTFTF